MKLQDVIHYYIGCNMTHKNNLGASYILHFDVLQIAISHGDMPVLRRLEDMTEDEAIELVGLVVHEDEYTNVTTYRHNVTNDLMVEWGLLTPMERANDVEYYFNATGERSWSAAQFHHLLTQHFDLFNLIDNGLAIDSKMKY